MNHLLLHTYSKISTHYELLSSLITTKPSVESIETFFIWKNNEQSADYVKQCHAQVVGFHDYPHCIFLNLIINDHQCKHSDREL